MASHQKKNATGHQTRNMEYKKRHHRGLHPAAVRARLGPDIACEMDRQQRRPVGDGGQPRGGPDG
eukprot:2124679-Pyramimonas_sp.AAC.1